MISPSLDELLREPSRYAVKLARRRVQRAGPAELGRALASLGEPLAGSLWLAAGAGATLAEGLRSAQRRSGRAVVEFIMPLHSALGLGPAADGVEPIQSEELTPYLMAAVQPGNPWRAILAGWIDVMAERLTLHRYADHGHRRRHARALLSAPLVALLAKDGGGLAPSAIAELDRNAEYALAFLDLRCALDVAPLGWNRIALPSTDQMGGFFGLADEARPPEPGEVIEQARALWAELQAAAPGSVDPRLDDWLARVRQTMLDALAVYIREGAWPDAPRDSRWRVFWRRLVMRA